MCACVCLCGLFLFLPFIVHTPMPQPAGIAGAWSAPVLLATFLALLYWQFSQPLPQQEEEERESLFERRYHGSRDGRQDDKDAETVANSEDSDVGNEGEREEGRSSAIVSSPLSSDRFAPLTLLFSWVPLLSSAVVTTEAAEAQHHRRRRRVRTRMLSTPSDSFVDGFTDLLVPHRRDVGLPLANEEVETLASGPHPTTTRLQNGEEPKPFTALELATMAEVSAPVDNSSSSSGGDEVLNDESESSEGWELIDTSWERRAVELDDAVTSVMTSAASHHRSRTVTTAQTTLSSAAAATVTRSANRSRRLDGRRGLCCICREAPSCMLYRPCNHVCTCMACAEHIDAEEAAKHRRGSTGGRESAAVSPSHAHAAGHAQSPSFFDTLFDSAFFLATSFLDAATAAPPTPEARCPMCNSVFSEKVRVYVT